MDVPSFQVLVGVKQEQQHCGCKAHEIDNLGCCDFIGSGSVPSEESMNLKVHANEIWQKEAEVLMKSIDCNQKDQFS